jgi:hypothetical protein
VPGFSSSGGATNRTSHRSQDREGKPDHEQYRPDDDQEMEAGDEESDDEQDDAKRDQCVSPEGVGLRAASLLDP